MKEGQNAYDHALNEKKNLVNTRSSQVCVAFLKH